MPFSTILYEVIDGVARITLNRPERANALNQAMLTEIGRALDEAEGNATVRAIVVRGAGAAFSSGFDLKEQMERRPTGVAAMAAHPAQGLRHRHALLALPEADHRRRARRPASPGPASWRSPATSRLPPRTPSSASRS